MSDGAIIPQIQTRAMAIASKRSLAPSVRLANQTETLRLYSCNFRLETERARIGRDEATFAGDFSATGIGMVGLEGAPGGKAAGPF